MVNNENTFKDEQYWNNFYKNSHLLKPSSFTKFVKPFLPKSGKIIEFGCGNGRDTYHWAKEGYTIVGIDSSNQPMNKTNVTFIKSDLIKYTRNYNCNLYDIVYSRFFLHSINNTEIDLLLNWSSGLFIAEFRAKEDVPLLYPNHYRNLIDGNDFLNLLIEKQFNIIHYSKSNGVAKFKQENPIVIRIIAKKEK